MTRKMINYDNTIISCNTLDEFKLQVNNLIFSEYLAESVVKYGKTEFLKYLNEMHCPITENTVYTSCLYGHYDCFLYMINNVCIKSFENYYDLCLMTAIQKKFCDESNKNNKTDYERIIDYLENNNLVMLTIVLEFI